jgi:hypothetical protein
LKAKLAAFLAGLFIVCAVPSLRADDNSDASTKQLAVTLEAAFNKHDIAAANATFDMDTFLDRATAGIPAPPTLLTDFRQRARTKSLLSSMIAAAGSDGSCHFLRTLQVNGEVRALCRELGSQGSLDYEEFVLGADAEKTPKFVDLYSAVDAELTSESIHRIFIAEYCHAQGGVPGQFSGFDRQIADNAAAVLQFISDSETGRYGQALSEYKALPAAIQRQKPIMSIRIHAAEHLQSLRPDEYIIAVADIQAAYPNDLCADLNSLGVLVREKRLSEAHEALDRLETFTGGDAYLQYRHGCLALMAGGDENLAAAKKYFDAAIDTESTLQQTYWAMLELSLKTKDFDLTAQMLTDLEQKFGVHLKDPQTVPAYAEFVKSDAYQKWKAEQN